MGDADYSYLNSKATGKPSEGEIVRVFERNTGYSGQLKEPPDVHEIRRQANEDFLRGVDYEEAGSKLSEIKNRESAGFLFVNAIQRYVMSGSCKGEESKVLELMGDIDSAINSVNEQAISYRKAMKLLVYREEIIGLVDVGHEISRCEDMIRLVRERRERLIGLRDRIAGIA